MIAVLVIGAMLLYFLQRQQREVVMASSPNNANEKRNLAMAVNKHEEMPDWEELKKKKGYSTRRKKYPWEERWGRYDPYLHGKIRPHGHYDPNPVRIPF